MKPDIEDLLRLEIVNGAKTIFQKGLVELGEGNVSLRVPKREELLITPTFNQYDKMTSQDVVHLRFDGASLSQGQPASTEHRLHIAVYQSRPHVGCVIHTHSTYATVLSIVRRRIPVLMEEMVIMIGGPIEVSKFGIAHTNDIGEKAVKALGSTNAALLANHGALVCGRTLEHTL
jgi:L-ribulose-5-phosphate 4-epimerase